jgi:DNA-binding NtrC family response regulator
MNKLAILIVDGDEALCNRVKALLCPQGLIVHEVGDATNLLQSLPRPPLRMMVVESGSDSHRQAADPFGTTPMDGHRHHDRCRRDKALATQGLSAGLLPQGPRMIGESMPIRAIKAYIGKVAATDSHVLITGETGTGKELVADLIHRNSLRASMPFVWVNCAAIPDSLFESELFGYERGAFTGAHTRKEGQLKLGEGGTVFLDEIGDMSPYAQAKILRAVESKAVYRLGGKHSIPLNVRLVAATNQDLELLVAQEKFRKDLYFRLNVARIHLPPLRQRKEDIIPLCAYYICTFNQRFGRQVEGFTPDALSCMLEHEWPGNVRELKNLLEAAFVNVPGRTISLRDLPEPFCRGAEDTTPLPQNERERLLAALLSTNWNVSKAAQQLHWSRMTLYRKMTKYHIYKGGNEAAGAATQVSAEV